MCCDTCLCQAIHYFLGSYIYVSVTLLVFPVVLVNYLSGDEFYCYVVIFVLVHYIFQLEVIGVYDKIFSIWGGEDAIPIYFSCG